MRLLIDRSRLTSGPKVERMGTREIVLRGEADRISLLGSAVNGENSCTIESRKKAGEHREKWGDPSRARVSSAEFRRRRRRWPPTAIRSATSGLPETPPDSMPGRRG